MSSAPQAAENLGLGILDGDRRRVAVDLGRQAGGDAQELPGRVRAVGLDDDRDGGARRVRPPAGNRVGVHVDQVGAQRAPFDEQLHRVAYLVLEGRVGALAPRPAHRHDLDRPDPRG